MHADYRRFVPITTRWMDSDVLGHVNNAAYYGSFDAAIMRLLVQRQGYRICVLPNWAACLSSRYTTPTPPVTP